MAGTGDAIELFELTNGASNLIFSKDQTRAYVANASGDIDVYDLATHTKIATWIVGNALGGMSLSDDGDFLLATEWNGQSAQYGPDGAILYRVDTSNGAVETFTRSGNGFRDVEIVGDNLALLTGGGTNTISTFDLTTGTFSSIPGGVAHSNFAAMVEGQRYTLFAETLGGDGRLFLYDKASGAFSADGTSYDGISGDNFGMVAMSEAAGLVLQGVYYDGLNIYDLNLDIVATRHFSGPIGGMAFDPTGEFVYIYLRESGNVEEYHVADWVLVDRIQVGSSTFNSNRSEFGNQLMIEGNGQWLTLKTNDGKVELIDFRIRNETFTGTSGADAFAGGKGNDHYYIDNPGDTITEYRYEGTDIAESSISFVLPAYVENLLLTGSAQIDGTGNALNNILQGNGAANLLDGGAGADQLAGNSGDDVLLGADDNDTLSGGEGADQLSGGSGLDTLDGGTGADSMAGGSGNDTYYVDSPSDLIFEDADSGDDTVVATASVYLSANIELLQLMDGGDYFGVGNDNRNLMFGNSGANLLIAGGGDDTVHGGDGSDTIYGQDGNDELLGQAGSDYMAGGVGLDRIDGGDGADALFGEAGDDALIGGAGTDLMSGGDGNDHLDGASGLGEADQLVGGMGDDNYVVDSAQDLIFEAAGEGIDVVGTSVGYYLFDNVENLFLLGGADIFGVGNALDNLIVGNEGSNLIIAGAGADSVTAGAGTDSVFGQDGADQLYGEAGNDVAVGGAGDDMLDGGDGGDGLYGEDGNDTIWAGTDFVFDQLVGGAGADVLHGDSGQGDFDYLIGNAGDDSFYVDTPADLVFENGGEGIDTVYASISGTGYYLYANIENLVLLGSTPYGVGNELDNRLTGSVVANWLLGGAGNDVLNGKGGNDVLFGEAGADIFVFEHGTGGDTIGDFTPGTDRIDLSALGFTSFAELQAGMSETGGSTAILLGSGDFIVLQGVANAALHEGDFILSGGSAADVAAEQRMRGADDGGPAATRGDLIHQFDMPRLIVNVVEPWGEAAPL